MAVAGDGAPIVFGRRRGLISWWSDDWLTRVSEEGILEVEDVGGHHVGAFNTDGDLHVVRLTRVASKHAATRQDLAGLYQHWFLEQTTDLKRGKPHCSLS